MKFADLFTPVAKVTSTDGPLRIMRILEYSSFNPIENVNLGNTGYDTCIPTAVKAGHALSAVSALLVPLQAPWRDGQRYAEAGASDIASRLDLFVADDSGPWVRRYGVLISVCNPTSTRAC